MIEPLFTIPHFIYRTANWKEKKEKFQSVLNEKSIYRRLKTPTGKELFSTDRIEGGYQNGNNGSVYLEDFTTIFQEEFDAFRLELSSDFQVVDVWSVKYQKGDRQHVHTHGTCNLSGVLYFDFDPTAHEATTFIPISHNPLTNTTPFVTPLVQEGDIVIFPSNILHYVETNTSDKVRTILAFDIEKRK